MNILFLYNKEYALSLGRWLEQEGNQLDYWDKPITIGKINQGNYELVISYSYRFLIPKEIISLMKGNIVNLHISFLPFNRGANPNEWSILEGTPSGVTIHYIDENLDKGRIIAQQIICFKEENTLAECYELLHKRIQTLFQENFQYYTYWPEMAKASLGKGTYHSVADFKPYEDIWENRKISIKDFRLKAKEMGYNKN